MVLTPQVAVIFAATTAAGFLMLLAGVHKGMLVWRQQARTCPSCGRRVVRRVCDSCTHSG